MENRTGPYDDIINLPHHVSEKHPQMSMHMRAAQFAPFAALLPDDQSSAESMSPQPPLIGEGAKG